MILILSYSDFTREYLEEHNPNDAERIDKRLYSPILLGNDSYSGNN